MNNDQVFINKFEKLNLKKIEIEESENCHYPSKEWKKLNCLKTKVERLPLDTPMRDDKIRVVCISDTHSRTSSMKSPIPKADILIHAGDLTKRGSLNELEEFSSFLASLNHIKHKIVIAGNHDKELDPNLETKPNNNLLAKKILSKNCTYLQDTHIKLYGIKFYGSPWQPVHCNNAFQLERGKDILEKWQKIPDDTDVLITHGPPLGYGDRTGGVMHVGCVELLNTVRLRVKPKYHIFGHIHEDYGVWSNGETTFINASICNSNYNPVNEPILIDIDNPEAKDQI